MSSPAADGPSGRVGLPVLLAIADPALEARVVAAWGTGRAGVRVVRRCVDLADLLAAAGTRTAVAAVVSAGLRRFDRAALDRLESAGVAVVGVVTGPDAETDEVRLRQIGLQQVVVLDAAEPGLPPEVAEAVAAAVRAADVPPAGATEQDDAPAGEPDPVGPAARLRVPGRLVAVWGPAGAPGRSFLTRHLADALGRAGHDVLVVDADVYGGTLAQLSGLVDEAPGLVAACRAANAGALDAARLASLARRLEPQHDGSGAVDVLTGLPRASRWPEVRPAALTAVLELARRLADVVLVDCGFCLEEDEELSYDTAAPRRNGATLAALGAADVVLVVGTAEPVGMTRLVVGLAELREALDGAGADPPLEVVVNRVRPTGRSRREVRSALVRHANVDPGALLPLDVEAADRAAAEGLGLGSCGTRSALTTAIAALADRLVDAAGDGFAAAADDAEPVARRRWRPLRRAG